MGTAMHPTRLRWCAHTGVGCARHDGVQVELRSAPRLRALAGATEIDMVPGIMAEVRFGADPKREMDAIERHECVVLLERIALQARGAL